MENLHKLEQTVASWYKDAPHLPENGRKWLATNAWWLVLIGVVLGAVGIASVVMATLLASAVLVGFGGVVGAAIGGIAFIAMLVALMFSIINIVLSGMAIMPLRALQRRGWTLLFIVILLNVASVAVSFLFNFNIFRLVWGVLTAAVGAYFLFEVRGYFKEASQPKKIEKKRPSKA